MQRIRLEDARTQLPHLIEQAVKGVTHASLIPHTAGKSQTGRGRLPPNQREAPAESRLVRTPPERRPPAGAVIFGGVIHAPLTRPAAGK